MLGEAQQPSVTYSQASMMEMCMPDIHKRDFITHTQKSLYALFKLQLMLP